jgi:hypothetical protein
MSQATTWQCRKDPYRLTRGLKHWLLLLLVLAFSTSGHAHIPVGDHAASTTSLSFEVASVGQGMAVEPDCGSDADETHGQTCCTGSVCSFCVPPISARATRMATITEVVESLPDKVHPGRASSPGLRPPRGSANG